MRMPVVYTDLAGVELELEGSYPVDSKRAVYTTGKYDGPAGRGE